MRRFLRDARYAGVCIRAVHDRDGSFEATVGYTMIGQAVGVIAGFAELAKKK